MKERENWMAGNRYKTLSITKISQTLKLKTVSFMVWELCTNKFVLQRLVRKVGGHLPPSLMA